MKQRTPVAAMLAACVLLALPAAADDAAMPGTLEPVSTRGTAVFNWDLEQKRDGFRRMEALFPASTVAAASTPRALPAGPPLAAFEPGGSLAAELEAFLAQQHVAGLLVLHGGKLRLERYALGHSPADRWTSFSVAKSITSTLVGAAIRDGYIGSLDDDVTDYIETLQGSAYDGVTVRQLMTMTSGVAFDEDYSDPESDIMKLYGAPPPSDMDATVAFMRDMEREAEPGTLWRYKTPETNLAGVLVMNATGRSLSAYLAEEIWRPYGMELDATWLIDDIGNEQGGCCLQVGLRDYARFGQFILEGGVIDGEPVLPEGWLELATSSQADTGFPGGYGFQWWPLGDGTFQARGIFGQLIHIDPARELVVVISAAWPEANEQERRMAQIRFVGQIAAAIDADAERQTH
ncbi:serine hydrolase [Wenzhouxiangella sp. XN24]|uniref:serine hydrolase domain-containing protein n=1 Tax=Wenzhouxiangella sp. XN24 TaxID=2713569 RepID=UPI0013ED8E04|nr:serine hydrolase [Wenzhouxiangella sp. XN24]NGX15573.1 serine hydrolase [Wenzhouxiangella sp. XN24]